jgi:PadR family transcriptional regulator PadR
MRPRFALLDLTRYEAHHRTVPPTTHDPQLLKGALSLLLLHLLAEQESYGYEVVQRLHALGLADVAEGTVYPALTRLEREGRLTARLVASSSGPARKYYRPTVAGREALAAGAEAWNHLTSIVDETLSRPLPAEPSGPAIASH